jgi:phage shock protein PspC (stress-responsive transcriptional regulator)
MERRWLRFRRDRFAGGVLSGLAWSLNVHPALPRAIALLLVFGGLPVPQIAALVVFGYIVAWVVLPEMPTALEPEVAPLVRGLTRPVKGRALAGVCLGVARYYKLDVRLVRLVTLVLSVAGGVGIIAYVGAWLLMPSAANQSEV